jgi:hypothetical protein
VCGREGRCGCVGEGVRRKWRGEEKERYVCEMCACVIILALGYEYEKGVPMKVLKDETERSIVKGKGKKGERRV